MNINLIGNICIGAALAGSVVGLVAAWLGGRPNGERRLFVTRAIAYINFWAMTVASFAMVYALVTNDFSVGYVTHVGSVSTPRIFAAVSLWSSLEGSILLWAWVLSGYAALCLYRYRPAVAASDQVARDLQPLIPWVAFTLMAVSIFFYLVLAFPANPFFSVNPTPEDGPGPNPLLQNHWLMVLHPPFLYLGFVGMTVPFAFGIASLIKGDITAKWLDATRRWTLAAWSCLTLAIMFGGWWSYAVLGWGGYWAWDPVENASFMPWLTATAFIHSIMVQQRRGMLKLWNLALIITTFLLTILGTFLTRSGVIESVHAFTQSAIGHYFLIGIVVALAASVGLLIWKAERFKSVGQFDHPICRETAILAGNLFFVCFCFVVLLGTLYPLIVEALRGVKVSVGEPFFNQMTAPIAMGLLFLMAIGVLLPWRRPDNPQLKSHLVSSAIIAVAASATAWIYGYRSASVAVTIALSMFALAIMLMDMCSAAWTNMRDGRISIIKAIAVMFSGHPRRYGGFIAHMGLVFIAAGVALSKGYQVERQISLKKGEQFEIEGYTIVLDKLFAKEEPQRFSVGARMNIMSGARALGLLEPRLNYYHQSKDPVGSPVVRSTLTEDLYLTLMAFDHTAGVATIRAMVTPAVSWLWSGGFIIVLGAVIAMRPKRVRSAECGVRN